VQHGKADFVALSPRVDCADRERLPGRCCCLDRRRSQIAEADADNPGSPSAIEKELADMPACDRARVQAAERTLEVRPAGDAGGDIHSPAREPVDEGCI
jgi:hypothetical protein